MKQLISLLFIALVTVISWSSCAKSEAITVTTVYAMPYSAESSSFLAPSLSTLELNEALHFPKANVVNNHNRFFELSIIFNDKLQQLIHFFSQTEDDEKNFEDNSFPTFTSNKTTNKACQEPS